jgi:hypothetical protein
MSLILFTCRIEEAAPILTGDSTQIKFKSGTPPAAINNKNGFVSTDELHQESKKTLQGLLPQVNARTSEELVKLRPVTNTPPYLTSTSFCPLITVFLETLSVAHLIKKLAY